MFFFVFASFLRKLPRLVNCEIPLGTAACMFDTCYLLFLRNVGGAEMCSPRLVRREQKQNIIDISVDFYWAFPPPP